MKNRTFFLFFFCPHYGKAIVSWFFKVKKLIFVESWRSLTLKKNSQKYITSNKDGSQKVFFFYKIVPFDTRKIRFANYKKELA